MLSRLIRSSAAREGMLAGAFVFGLLLAGISLFGTGNNAVADLVISGPRDCDTNSVMHCGALSTSELKTKYDSNAPGDIPAIYNHFGISSADIDSLSTKAEVGVVKADGTVWISDKLVGVNAHTAGRNKTTNSVAIADTKAYKRPPSDSFASSSTTIKVFIGYENGVPAWGVISSCGNPLIWDSPAVSIEKQVRKNANDSWHQEVTIDDGSEAEFRIQIIETTGIVEAQDIVVKDMLPKGLELVAGSVKIGELAANFANGEIAVGKVAKGATVDVLFKVKANVVDSACGVIPIDNSAQISGLTIAAKQDSAVVNVNKKCAEPEPKPEPEPEPHVNKSIECRLLTASRSTLRLNDIVVLTAQAAVTNTTVKNYIFAVDDVVVQTSPAADYTYTAATPGTHRVRATVESADGQTVTSDSCVRSVVVDSPSTVTCDSLSASKLTLNRGEKSEMTVKASKENAEITGYIFKVNDAVAQNSTNNTFIYEAVNSGTHTVTATVKSTLGEKTSNTCMVTITVAQVPNATPVYTCDSFALDKVTAKTGESVKTTTRITARDGAVFKMARIRYGDEVRPTDSFSTNAVNNGVITTDHTYTKAGDYTPRVSLEFEVDGALKTVDDPKCAASIKVSATSVQSATTTPTPPPATQPQPQPQPTPTTLPATGPGNFAGLFSGLTIAGAAAHRSRTIRKLVKK